jgi:hypothetical protein
MSPPLRKSSPISTGESSSKGLTTKSPDPGPPALS